ncbi:hypothetical protein OVA24_17030 [Luteolibacter sp. SL250]|uniref:hypothetical protein n=1 Tax=Luteolibacter sp. SL250 TaxID=2995170 RepID=UPI0022704535|nr:hypothetical protein [Luteolibacter sp. SL250]WAC18938.1 hypothetical protein OVA24_17030 [Luteolibacter sp. SL250]
MNQAIAIFCCAVLASCAPKPAPTSVVPPAPPRATAVAPEVGKLRDHIAEADRMATAIDSGAKEARLAATRAREEAERLKDRKTATEAELTRLWQDLQTMEARNLFLETETARLAANLTDARKTAATLQQHAAAKDAEADQLRAAHTHLTSTVADYATQITASNKAAEAQRTRADKLAGEIRLHRIALGICVAIALAWVAAKLLLPPRLLA